MTAPPLEPNTSADAAPTASGTRRAPAWGSSSPGGPCALAGAIGMGFGPKRRDGLLAEGHESAIVRYVSGVKWRHQMLRAVALIAVVLVAVSGCNRRSEDLEEIRRDQREILFRLGSLTKAIEQAGSRAPAQPGLSES